MWPQGPLVASTTNLYCNYFRLKIRKCAYWYWWSTDLNLFYSVSLCWVKLKSAGMTMLSCCICLYLAQHELLEQVSEIKYIFMFNLCLCVNHSVIFSLMPNKNPVEYLYLSKHLSFLFLLNYFDDSACNWGIYIYIFAIKCETSSCIKLHLTIN